MTRPYLAALWFVFLALMLHMPARAVIETYEFDSDLQRQRYRDFIEELRCPKCQNQNLAGSNSPISADLRRELHRLLLEGKSDQEIVDYMVSRYGEFVLYRPPMNKHTAVLWLLPVALLALGALVVFMLLRRRSPVMAVDVQQIHRQAEDVLARYRQEDRE
jgi:cytochrome c-type biogenesis protein CcmH